MVRNCPNCGKPLKEGYDFCGKCGSKLINNESIKGVPVKILDEKNKTEVTDEKTESNKKNPTDDLKKSNTIEKPIVKEIDGRSDKIISNGESGDIHKSKSKLFGIIGLVIVIIVIIAAIGIAINLSRNNNSNNNNYINASNNNNIQNTPLYNPSADFSFSKSGATVYFTDMSTDSDGWISNCNWNFGDGQSSTQQNPTHTYSSAGTYSVSLTVTDNDGLTDLITKTIQVNPPDIKIIYQYKSDTIEGIDKVGYVYITIKNEGGPGEGTVNVTAYQGSEQWTNTQNVYLNEGESKILTFRFPQIHFWTLDPWDYYVSIE